MSNSYKKPKHLGKVEIRDETTGEVYLRRWYLFRCRRFSIRIHHILSPDPGREPHDHPWNFVSLMLRRGYVETATPRLLPGEKLPAWLWGTTRVIRTWVFHRATDLHRISAVPEGGAWTLMITGAEQRVWGFETRQGWVPWMEHHV